MPEQKTQESNGLNHWRVVEGALVLHYQLDLTRQLTFDDLNPMESIKINNNKKKKNCATMGYPCHLLPKLGNQILRTKNFKNEESAGLSTYLYYK